MAMNGDSSVKEDHKTRFSTREAPIPLNAVHLSLVTIPGTREYSDRLCLNIGKELYIYVYKGIKSGADMATQIEKKSYKTMNPTCHNFNSSCASSESVPLLVGFNTGIVMLQDIIRKDICKVFNEEKLVDSTKVTCIQWVPNSKQLFLTSHASGQLYLYNAELPCSTSPPNYQFFKGEEGYTIHVCKTKTTRNPLYRWVLGSENSCINQFAFSPCNLYLAIVSQDGFLRVFHYDTMELVGIARSYFGGLLCVCWSPDSKYVAVGGEDDLVTIWSFQENKIVARGQGHHSWINVVAFDPFTSSFLPSSDQSSENQCFSTCYRLGSVGQDTQLCLWDITDDLLRHPVLCNAVVNLKAKTTTTTNNDCSSNNGEACTMSSSTSSAAITAATTICAGGSGGCSSSGVTSNHISNNCKSTASAVAVSTHQHQQHHHHHQQQQQQHHLHHHHHHVNYVNHNSVVASSAKDNQECNTSTGVMGASGTATISKHSPPSLTQRIVLLGFGERRDSGGSTSKKYSSRSSSNGSDKYNISSSSRYSELEDPMKLIGTAACPRFDQCPLLEPLICKKISNERLSALVFKEDCILTSCYDGSVYTWARPERITSANAHLVAASSMSTALSNDSTSTIV